MEREPSKVSRRALLAGAPLVAATLLGRSAAAWATERPPAALELLDAKVDLVLNAFSSTLVSGTLNGVPVRATGSLFGDMHGRPGTVTGSLAGRHVASVLSIKDQVPSRSGYVTTARLTASVGEDAFALSGSFDLDSHYRFTGGTITGSDRGLSVQISAEPHSWEGNIGYGAKMTGRYAGSPVSVTAEVPLGQPGWVKGSVGHRALDLRVAPGQQNGARLSGTYSGPVELLVLIIGAVAFFAS